MISSAFSRLIPPGKPVIDIAMGNGRDLISLAVKGFPAYGLERSDEAIKLAMQAAEKQARTHGSRFKGDAHHLPFRAGVAGCVLVFYFLVREIMDDLAAGCLRRAAFSFTKRSSSGRTYCPGRGTRATSWTTAS